MSTRHRDTRAASWARTWPRLVRLAEELREHDFQVTPPDHLEVHPAFRNGRTSAIVEVSSGDVGDEKVQASPEPNRED